MALPNDSVSDADLDSSTDDNVDLDDGGADDAVDLDTGDDGTGTGAVDPFAEYGGADAVKSAVELHNKMKDPDGALESFFHLGRSFGLGVREIEALFSGGDTGTDTAEDTGPADDDVMTFADFKRLMNEQVTVPMQQQAEQRRQDAAAAAVQSTIKELGIEDDATKAAILQLGDRYLGDDLSPEAVSAAVRKGHADFVAVVQANADKYRAQKAAQAKLVPKTLKGAGTVPSTDSTEPRDVKEAILRARKRLGI